jgi:hypothetical protein
MPSTAPTAVAERQSSPAGGRGAAAAGLRQWKTFDAVGNGHTQAQVLPGSTIVDHILAELHGCNIIAIGPVVTGDGILAPHFYCVLASRGEGGFFTLVCGITRPSLRSRTGFLRGSRSADTHSCVLAHSLDITLAASGDSARPRCRPGRRGSVGL